MMDATIWIVVGVVVCLIAIWGIAISVRFIRRVLTLFRAEQRLRSGKSDPAPPQGHGTPTISLTFDPETDDGVRVTFESEDTQSAFDERGTIHTRVAGVTHANKDGTPRQAIIQRCLEGEGVFVIREPENSFDSSAIRVVRVNGEQLGYVPRSLAAKMAPWMDRGYEYGAEIGRIVELQNGKMFSVTLIIQCVKPGRRGRARRSMVGER